MYVQIYAFASCTHKIGAHWFVCWSIMSVEKVEFLERCNKKRLKPGDCVEGKFGPLVPNPNAQPVKKTCSVCLQRTVVLVKVVSTRMWQVKADKNSEYVNLCSCIFKLIDGAVSVPLNEVDEKVNKANIIFFW